jgi:hypothetical protein
MPPRGSKEKSWRKRKKAKRENKEKSWRKRKKAKRENPRKERWGKERKEKLVGAEKPLSPDSSSPALWGQKSFEPFID